MKLVRFTNTALYVSYRLFCKYILILFTVTSAFFVGCSTQKDGFANRAFHNTTARYNGYFNAKESIKEGVQAINLAHVDDYEEVLPLYIIADEEKASEIFPPMDKAIKKSSEVIGRHSMNIRGKERCRWIDDNYLAVGMAHFYKREYDKAAKIFQYIIKEYTDKDNLTRYRAQTWLVRTHVENKDLNEAGLIVDLMNQNKEFPERIQGERFKATAHYYIAKKNYLSAAEALKQAIPLERKKKNRIRQTYILAQLYQRSGKALDAQQYFDQVALKSNDYAMAFNAKISQALAVQNKSSSYTVKADLLKMLSDAKNFDYYDQIYYALGEVSFVEKKPLEATDYFRKSAAASTTNTKQKSKSFLRLAEYYFGQKRYEPAQQFYDSAVSVLSTSFDEYAKIKATANDLDSLIGELRIIKREDSLLILAKLPEAERSQRIDEIAKQLQKIADEEADAKAALLSNASPLAPGASPAPLTASTTGDFYFYNTAAKGSGFNDFRKKWGNKRLLEDNWRRSNKNQAEGGLGGFAEDGSPITGNTSSVSASGATKIDKAKLLADLPLSEQQQQASSQRIVDALYNSGIMYKEKFKDTESAIESFENMLSRFDSTKYEVVAYYQLYRMYLAKETSRKSTGFFSDNKSSSLYYKDLILTQYPNSEFAKLLQSDGKLEEKDSKLDLEKAAYREAFTRYKEGNLTEALLKADSLITSYPNSKILSKFCFLKARIYADLRNIDAYKSQLSFITLKFPNTDEAKEAKRILDFLNARPVNPADSATTASINTSVAGAIATPSEYILAEDVPHYFLLFFGNIEVDPNTIKSKISDFNQTTFSNSQFEMSTSFIDNDNQYILLKSFTNKKEAMAYHTAFMADKKFLKAINTAPVNQAFVITVPNFINLFKTKHVQEYAVFFKENYTK